MTLVRFILVLGERLVPASARNRWREEWEAELESMGRGSGPRPGTISLTVAVAMDVRAMRRAARISPEPRVRGQWFDVTRQDLLYAMRSLKRVPGFTLAAVATLAIGIGINTAIFSVVKTVLLEPPPFPRPDELVGLYMTTEEVGYGVASPAAVRHWQTRNDLFVDVAAHRGVSFNLRGSGDPERPHGAAATPSIFSVLGVRPFLGRTLVQGDDAPGADPVVVIAHGLWQRQFGSDSSVIGTTLNLDGEPHTLVGVMPPGHGYPFQAELWIPLILSSETWQSRGSYFLGATARLRPDVTTEQATTALSSAGSEYSPPSRQFATRVQRIHDAEVGWMAKNLWLLFAAVGLVLLIACANVANLQLARGESRYREIAVRSALGAHRTRLIRQLLTENIMIGLLGGTAGVGLAAVGVRLATRAMPTWFPRTSQITIDGTTLGYTLFISVITAMLFGMVPALRSANRPVAGALRTGIGAREQVSLGRHGLGRLLVISQVAVALLLVISSGLLMRSFAQLANEDLGFDPSNRIAMFLALPAYAYPENTQQHNFFSTALERVRSLPGISSAAVANSLPMSNWRWMTSFTIMGATDERLDAHLRVVSQDYFSTLGIPIRSGRPFSEVDGPGGPESAIVNERFVRDFLPDTEPLGTRLDIRNGPENVTIVGVVGDERHIRPGEPPKPALYRPFAQSPRERMFVVAHTRNVAAGLTQTRDVLHSLDPELPVTQLSSLEGYLSGQIAESRFYTLLMMVFAFTALTLASIGVYGILTYLVSRRVREIGVRMALGAPAREVMLSVIFDGLRLAIPGLVLGVTAALFVTRLLQHLLYEITATDPMTYAIIVGVVITVVILSSYLPARRSTRVHPLEALRTE